MKLMGLNQKLYKELPAEMRDILFNLLIGDAIEQGLLYKHLEYLLDEKELKKFEKFLPVKKTRARKVTTARNSKKVNNEQPSLIKEEDFVKPNEEHYANFSY